MVELPIASGQGSQGSGSDTGLPEGTVGGVDASALDVPAFLRRQEG